MDLFLDPGAGKPLDVARCRLKRQLAGLIVA
jgi:hypothetical protein